MSLAPAEDLADELKPYSRWDRLRRAGAAVSAKTIASAAGACLPVALALAAAVVAVGISFSVFPLLSQNNDEAIYLLQADALRHGRLFPPAPQAWEAFLPALSVWRDGHYVPKYTPVHAGIIAIGGVITRSQRGGLAMTAALAAVTSYLLGRQVLKTRRAALIGSAFFALSPLTLIQSATFLSYLSALGLMQGFAAALIAGTRRRSPLLLWLGGFCLGTALFSRPYDTCLFALPFGLWLVWSNRKAIRNLAPVLVWGGLGAALPLTAMVAYFHAATGAWFDSPFNLLHPSDTIGFGSRQIYPESQPTIYTPALAWIGMSQHLLLMSTWCFGGPALAALAVAGRKKMGWDEPGPWLGLVAVTVPLGYFFFWGSYGSIKWGAPFRLGPFYYLPLLAPLSILGAAGFDRLSAGRRRLGLCIVLAMLGLSGMTFAKAVHDHAPFLEARRQLYGPLLTQPMERSVVFLPRLTGSSLLTHPFALARNSADFSGRVIWALDRGPAANRRVMVEFPDRIPYRLVSSGMWRPEGSQRGDGFEVRLERITTALCPSTAKAPADPVSCPPGDTL